MGYSIKILSSEEFDKLPYRHSSIALGVADPRKNTAYVRQTASTELNKYLIDHEFEHLIEEHPTDEIDGVRYKIPLIGPLISGLGSGLMGKVAPTIATSFMPSIAGGIAKAGTGIGTALGTKGLFGGLQNVGQSMYGGLQKAGSGLMGMFKPSSGALPQNARVTMPGSYQPQQQSQSRQGFGGILDAFKNPATLLGGLSLGAGLLKGYPKAPDVSQLPSVQQFKNVQSPGQSPLGQQSQSVISSNLMKQFNPLTSEELTAATTELEQGRLRALQRLEGEFASAMPGVEYVSSSRYNQRANAINREFEEAKANVVGDRTRTAEAYFNQNQLQNLALAKDWSIQEAEFVYKFKEQLAQMDVDQIMLQYQVDYQKALDWKQTAISIGSGLLMQGFGIPQIQGV